MKIEGNAVQKIKEQVKTDMWKYCNDVINAFRETGREEEEMNKILFEINKIFVELINKIDNTNIIFTIGDKKENED